MINLTHLQKLANEGDIGAMAYLLKYTGFDLEKLDMPEPLRAAVLMVIKQFKETHSTIVRLERVEIAEYTYNLIYKDGLSKSEECNGAYYIASQKYNCSVSKPRNLVKIYYPDSM